MFRQVKTILFQSLKDFVYDNGLHWAASIAYFSIISAFPLLLLGAVIGSLFVESEWIVQRLSAFVDSYLPEYDLDIGAAVEEAMDQRARIGVISVLALLWTATRALGALVEALNTARDPRRRYKFLKIRLVELAVLGAISIVFLAAFASRFLLVSFAEALGMAPEDRSTALEVASWSATALLLYASFLGAYYLIPKPKIGWGSSAVGALAATVLFIALQPIFVFYLREMGDMSLFYGPAASAVIVLFWFWIVAAITLVGGEIATHTQAIAVEGKSSEELEEERKG